MVENEMVLGWSRVVVQIRVKHRRNLLNKARSVGGKIRLIKGFIYKHKNKMDHFFLPKEAFVQTLFDARIVLIKMKNHR